MDSARSPAVHTSAGVLEAVELFELDLELRRPVGTAQGAHLLRPVIFVRLVTSETEGWGECAALATGTAVDAPVDAVWNGLVQMGVPRLFAAVRARSGMLPPAAQVSRLFSAGPLARAIAATLEMAVLDAELRAASMPLWQRLGVEETRALRGAPVGHLVGIPQDRSIGTLVDAVGSLSAHAARVRVKIEPGWDVEPVRALRAAFPDLLIQVDANGSYRLDGGGLEDAERLVALDRFGLGCIEQPLPAADLVALAAVAQRLETAICLDESLTTPRRLLDAIRYGACEVACIKPTRFGGLLGARSAQQLCASAGIPAFVGGFFETGFARAANAALALLDGFGLPSDVSDPGEYLAEDPLGYPGADGSVVRPYDGPGWAELPRLTGALQCWSARVGRDDT